jgi:hypothetical protein
LEVRWEGGNEISSSKNLVTYNIYLLRNKFVLFCFGLSKCGAPCGVLGTLGKPLMKKECIEVVS